MDMDNFMNNHVIFFRGSLLKSCWSRTATKRPTAAEIAELLFNNPRLVSPCIDVPLASVQMERTDSLELIPSTKKSPVHSTIVASGQKPQGSISDYRNCAKNVKESQNRNSIYSPMHSSSTSHQLSDISITKPLVSQNTDTPESGYYKADSSLTEPLVIQDTDFTDSNGYYKADSADRDHNVTVGSYVQPGYIYLGEGEWRYKEFKESSLDQKWETTELSKQLINAKI